MPFYLTQFVEQTTQTPRGGTQVTSVALGQDAPGAVVLDLRPDGGATWNGGGKNAAIQTRLAKASTSTRLNEILAEILTLAPEKDGVKRLYFGGSMIWSG